MLKMDRSLQSVDPGTYGCFSSVVLRTNWMNNDTDRPSDSLSARPYSLQASDESYVVFNTSSYTSPRRLKDQLR